MMRSLRTIRIVTYAMAVLVSAGAIRAARAQEADNPKKVVTVEGITEYRYKNGLRFLSYPDAASSSVTINMTVLVGSRHEGYGEAGMAHLLEHMLFKGSKLYPNSDALDKAMQAHGVSRKEYNATTWTDRTNYYETFPASAENLRFGLEMEADRLYTAHIRREDLAKEMTVVRNEFERGEDNPAGILNQRMYAAAFEWHNYGKSTIGNRADIERYPIERLQGFYKKYYRVDNIVLTVAGKFDEKKALADVTKYFGGLKAPDTPIENTYTEEPAQDGERSVTVRRVGKVPIVGLMYHIPATAHPDNAACEVLGLVLGDTPTGRLYKALVEKKKASSVSYGVTNWHDPGVIEFTARALDKVPATELRDLMIDVVEEMPKNPATEEEVARMVRKYLSYREQVMTKSNEVALELSEWIGAGDWRLLFLHRDRVAKVKAADVNRVAAKYLKQSNRTVGMFLPSATVVRTPVPEAPSLASVFKDFKGGKEIAAGETFDATPENIEKRVKRFTLSNGLKVAFLPKKTRGETVTGELVLRFGDEKSLTGKTTPAGLIGTMMMRGTKTLSRAQIQEQLDKLKSTLSVSSGTGTISVSWDSTRGHNAELLTLLREVLREPIFPAGELDELKTLMKQSIERGMTDPQSLAVNALNRKLNPHPSTSIHYVPTLEESLQRIAKVTRDDLVKIYQDQIGATHGELAIVGDFDPEATVKQLEAMFAGWKSDTPYKRIPDVLVKDVKGSIESINTPDRENAIFLSAFRFAMDDNDPDYTALEIGNEILGGSFTSRLVDRFRQKEGWSYGASSRLSVGSLDKVSRFLIYASCKPNVIDRVTKAADEELARIIKDGVTNEEVKLAITHTLENMRLERGKDNDLVSTLRQGLRLNRTMVYEAQLEKKYAAVTVQDVNRALAAHLIPSRLVTVRAGDFKKKQ
ncbi:MAG TPA: pitrilysin family protein [Gemmataceae bacterium]|nr:pitrilysin family protein [Gemmataceae bacterium]